MTKNCQKINKQTKKTVVCIVLTFNIKPVKIWWKWIKRLINYQLFNFSKGAFTNDVYKIWLFLTTYPPPLVNVVCEHPLTVRHSKMWITYLGKIGVTLVLNLANLYVPVNPAEYLLHGYKTKAKDTTKQLTCQCLLIHEVLQCNRRA